MTDTLNFATRPLPVAWDGIPVEWQPWARELDIHICPPPKPGSEPCPSCGLDRPRIHARGVRVGTEQIRPLHLPSMYAFRCTHCAHDQVICDGQVWDLDPTDYGPHGSHAQWDMTAHVQPARPDHYHQAAERHCPECGATQLAGHVRCRDCPDPRRPR